jgi:hypothetical protein
LKQISLKRCSSSQSGAKKKQRHLLTPANVTTLVRSGQNPHVYEATVTNPNAPKRVFFASVNSEEDSDRQGDYSLTLRNEQGEVVDSRTNGLYGVTMNFDGRGAVKEKRNRGAATPMIQRFHPNNNLPGSGAFCLGVVVELARQSGAGQISIRPRMGSGILALLTAFGFRRGQTDNVYRKQLPHKQAIQASNTGDASDSSDSVSVSVEIESPILPQDRGLQIALNRSREDQQNLLKQTHGGATESDSDSEILRSASGYVGSDEMAVDGSDSDSDEAPANDGDGGQPIDNSEPPSDENDPPSGDGNRPRQSSDSSDFYSDTETEELYPSVSEKSLSDTSSNPDLSSDDEGKFLKVGKMQLDRAQTTAQHTRAQCVAAWKCLPKGSKARAEVKLILNRSSKRSLSTAKSVSRKKGAGRQKNYRMVIKSKVKQGNKNASQYRGRMLDAVKGFLRATHEEGEAALVHRVKSLVDDTTMQQTWPLKQFERKSKASIIEAIQSHWDGELTALIHLVFGLSWENIDRLRDLLSFHRDKVGESAAGIPGTVHTQLSFFAS